MDKLKKSDIKDIYPLSPMQKGLLYHSLTDNKSFAYIMQFKYTLKGVFNWERFEKTIDVIYSKYDVLRTIFLYKKVANPLQVVLKKTNPDIKYFDISTKNNPEEEIEQILLNDRKTAFNLDKEVSMRLIVIKRKDNIHEIVWSHHHIILDGWCMGILLSDFIQIYFRNPNNTYNTSIIQYNSYIKWLRELDNNESIRYWKNYLSDYKSKSFLPFKTNKAEDFENQKKIQGDIGQELYSKIKKICDREAVSANSVFQAIWGVLLCKYANNDDCVFNTIVSGRPPEIHNVEKIVGLFINIVPVRIQVKNDTSILDIVKKHDSHAIELLSHQYLTLADIIKYTQCQTIANDHLFLFNNYPRDFNQNSKAQSNWELEVTDIDVFQQTHYPLSVILSPGENSVFYEFSYYESIIDDAIVQAIKNTFIDIIEQFSFNIKLKVQEIQFKGDFLQKVTKDKLEHDFEKRFDIAWKALIESSDFSRVFSSVEEKTIAVIKPYCNNDKKNRSTDCIIKNSVDFLYENQKIYFEKSKVRIILSKLNKILNLEEQALILANKLQESDFDLIFYLYCVSANINIENLKEDEITDNVLSVIRPKIEKAIAIYGSPDYVDSLISFSHTHNIDMEVNTIVTNYSGLETHALFSKAQKVFKHLRSFVTIFGNCDTNVFINELNECSASICLGVPLLSSISIISDKYFNPVPKGAKGYLNFSRYNSYGESSNIRELAPYEMLAKTEAYYISEEYISIANNNLLLLGGKYLFKQRVEKELLTRKYIDEVDVCNVIIEQKNKIVIFYTSSNSDSSAMLASFLEAKFPLLYYITYLLILYLSP